jgi:hypothetical protein
VGDSRIPGGEGLHLYSENQLKVAQNGKNLSTPAMWLDRGASPLCVRVRRLVDSLSSLTRSGKSRASRPPPFCHPGPRSGIQGCMIPILCAARILRSSWAADAPVCPFFHRAHEGVCRAQRRQSCRSVFRSSARAERETRHLPRAWCTPPCTTFPDPFHGFDRQKIGFESAPNGFGFGFDGRAGRVLGIRAPYCDAIDSVADERRAKWVRSCIF